MLSADNLQTAAAQALEYLAAQPDVESAEVFASADANLTVRLNYTSHIPSNGVEEPKSAQSSGIGLRIVFRPGPDSGNRPRTGFGSEPNDLSLDGVRRALDKARAGAVHDPEFVSLPQPDEIIPPPTPTPPAPDANAGYDPAIMNVDNEGLVDSGWRMMDRALDAFGSAEELATLAGHPDRVPDLGLILGGDVVLLQSRMAIASTRLPQPQSEQNTLLMAFATAMVERQNAKGSGWSVQGRLAAFDGRAAAEAARSAIAAAGLEHGGAQRLPTGEYRVILGPQPVAEILEWILLPGLQTEMFYAGASPFLGQLGRPIASPQLTIYDDAPLTPIPQTPGIGPQAASPASPTYNPANPTPHPSNPTPHPELVEGHPGARQITDEGLPAARVNLITRGELTGLLSDYYNYRRIRRDPDARRKLGCDPAAVLPAIAPRNGYRPGNGGGRNFAAPPSAAASNLVVEAADGLTHDQLLRQVNNGVYIGRIWYTYPVNGITSGDFSGTIIADSYIIKDGRLTAPLQPNTLRMNDNAHRILNHIIGITAHRRPTVRWSSDQVTWAPEIAIDAFHLEEISEYMDGVYQ